MQGPTSHRISAVLLATICLLFALVVAGCGEGSKSPMPMNNGTGGSGGNGGSGGGGGTGGGGGGTGGGGGGTGGGGGGTGGGSGTGQSVATYLYVGNQGPDNYYFTESKTPESISIFKVDGSTSNLTRVGGFGDESKFIAQYLFVAGNWLLAQKDWQNFSLIKIDPATGKLGQQIDSSAGHLLAVSPNGKFAVIGENGNLSSFSVNQSDGTLTKVSSVTQTCSPVDLNSQWDPSGRYFVLNNCLGTVVSVDPQTGVIQANATNAEGLATATQIGFDSTGTHYIAAARDQNGGEFRVYDFNAATLSMTPAGTGPDLGDASVFTIAGNYLYTRDGTGHVFQLGGSPFAVTDTGMTFDQVSGWRQPFIVDMKSHTAFIVEPGGNTVTSLRIGSNGGLSRTDEGNTGTAPWVMAVAHF